MGENTASKKGKPARRALTIELTTVGGNNLPVYITGNFNDWKVADERFQLQQVGENKYRFEFPKDADLPVPLEYKYLRGGWESVELDQRGNPAYNRKIDSSTHCVEDNVPLWKNEEMNYNPEFLPGIQIISENFEIPQLIKTRRISALLPYDYAETDRRYPVMYLQDGQNLFDDHAPFGNWAVDKKLAHMSEQGKGDVIIIAIDHAEDERIAEFTPSYYTRLGRGEGKKYVRFLADTLKPYVDQHFRTLPDRNHTGIGGSSMGGLISIYAGFMYPEVYSKLMVFSPSLWVAPKIHFHGIEFDEASPMKIYLYGGGEESVNMIPNIKRFKEALENQGIATKIDFNLSIDPEGKHNEARWGEEFPKAVKWLFFRDTTELQS